jgi:Ca2+/Na+ antiporter
MNNKKSLSFPLIIIVIILGGTLFKKFNFETLKFEKPALAIVYIICVIISIYFLVKNFKNQPKK